MGLIKKIDFLYQEAHFTFNKNGDAGLKTLFGGILSLIAIIFSISISIYFLIRLLLKKDATVILSTKQDSNINLLYSNKFPILFRLSDRVSHPLNDLDLYELRVNFWYSKPQLDDEIQVQQYTNLTFKKCNIYEHFNEYKKYFVHDKDLDSFFCLDPRNDNETLYGIYGDRNPFSYFQFEYYLCNNKTMNNQCLSKEEMKTILDDAYLVIRYINYNIESNKKNVKSISIKSERIPISYSVYKRIWITFKTIEFITDNGIMFSKYSKDIFHQLSSLRVDSDLRDIENGNVPGHFFSITFSLNGEVSIFNKSYLKLSNLLATIGGLIKIITFTAQLINYYNAQNSYYKKIIKDFLIENNIYRKEKNLIINKSDYKLNNLVNNSNFKLNIKDSQKTVIFTNLENKLKNKDNFESRFKYTLLPFKLSTTKHDAKEMRWYIETINSKLNIIYILNILEQYHKLKELIQKEVPVNEINTISGDILYKNNFLIKKSLN